MFKLMEPSQWTHFASSRGAGDPAVPGGFPRLDWAGARYRGLIQSLGDLLIPLVLIMEWNSGAGSWVPLLNPSAWSLGMDGCSE
ncbi:Uncharacterized protein HZ326_19132 [Fusarium oxysporum f. sp. albedinis]|nr:Uncharacterized protein HZ326_19132 [Fusarium oxysporum f. sp. albedinis]